MIYRVPSNAVENIYTKVPMNMPQKSKTSNFNLNSNNNSSSNSNSSSNISSSNISSNNKNKRTVSISEPSRSLPVRKLSSSTVYNTQNDNSLIVLEQVSISPTFYAKLLRF